MWQSKRVIRKQKKRNKIIIPIFSLFIFIILVLFFFSFKFLYFNGGKFLNPVAKGSFSQETNLSQYLKAKGIDVLKVSTLYDSSYVVDLKDGEQIIFSDKKSLETQVSSLQLMLSRLKIEGKNFKILDFRYDNPVVSF